MKKININLRHSSAYRKATTIIKTIRSGAKYNPL